MKPKIKYPNNRLQNKKIVENKIKVFDRFFNVYMVYSSRVTH